MNPDPAVPRLLINKLTRQHWSTDRGRVVRLVVIAKDGKNTATVWGAQDGEVVLLQKAEDVTVPKSRAPRVVLTDGTVWEGRGVGCSCNVPGPLRSFKPLQVAANA